MTLKPANIKVLHYNGLQNQDYGEKYTRYSILLGSSSFLFSWGSIIAGSFVLGSYIGDGTEVGLTIIGGILGIPFSGFIGCLVGDRFDSHRRKKYASQIAADKENALCEPIAELARIDETLAQVDTKFSRGDYLLLRHEKENEKNYYFLAQATNATKDGLVWTNGAMRGDVGNVYAKFMKGCEIPISDIQKEERSLFGRVILSEQGHIGSISAFTQNGVELYADIAAKKHPVHIVSKDVPLYEARIMTK